MEGEVTMILYAFNKFLSAFVVLFDLFVLFRSVFDVFTMPFCFCFVGLLRIGGREL
jgi:hypothetical protein